MSNWQSIETAPEDVPILGYGIWQGEIYGVSAGPVIDIIEGRADHTDHDKSDVIVTDDCV